MIVLTILNTNVIIWRMTAQQKIVEILDSGLTQQQVAGLIGCSQSLISALKKGRRGAHISKEIGDSLDRLHKKMRRQGAGNKSEAAAQ